MKKHSLLSPSSAHRWMTCPGSVYLSSLCPPPPTSPYAEEGTKAHALAEAILRDVFEHGKKFVDAFSAHGAKLSPDDEMLWYVKDYCLAILEIASTLKSPKIEIELKVKFNSDIWGTLDFVAFDKNRAAIIDLKYGQGVPVEAENNPQLAAYACAFDTVKGPFLGGIDCYIFQPRCEHANGPLRKTYFSQVDLNWWKTLISRAANICVRQFEEKTPTYEAGEHCRFCPAVAVCKTHEEFISERAGTDFEVIATTPPPPETLPDEKIRRLVLARSQIEKYLGAVEEYAISRFQDYKPIDGLKVVRGRANRRWIKDEELVASHLKRLGCAPYEQKLIGIGAAERIVGRGKIDDITEKPDESTLPLKVVSADDPREEARIGNEQAAIDFN